jgi:hypothetical protein
VGRQICFSKRPPSWTSFPDKPRLRLRGACRATSGPQFPRLQSERINRKSQAVAVARAGLSGSAYWLPAIGLEFCHVQYDSRENFLSWKEIQYLAAIEQVMVPSPHATIPEANEALWLTAHSLSMGLYGTTVYRPSCHLSLCHTSAAKFKVVILGAPGQQRNSACPR